MHPAVTEPPPAPRRVREQARAAAAVMVFSALVSVGFATALVINGHLGQRG
jgi:creatinine amidohydrolase/Fe(II)-dependent formamide hydrolase-like protein